MTRPVDRPWRAVAQVMGMPVSVALRGRHAGDLVGQSAWREAVAVLQDVDRVFSPYRPDSVVRRLGRGELSLEDCPAEVREVLEIGERARLDSAGAFDVRRPGPDGVRRLDPSGVVKGWAVERASRPLRRLPGTDVCLAAGGDLVAHVAEPDGAPWTIGIEDPHDPRRTCARVPVRRGAVATSGAAHRGHHVTDARTGRVPRTLASVTVVAADLTTADVDATAAWALDAAGPAWLRDRGRDGLVVHVDGRREALRG